MLNTIKIETADENTLDYLQRKSDRSKACYRFDVLDMMKPNPAGKRWLIKGAVALGETSAWIAPPGALKSALMAQLAIAVANHQDWNGLKHKKWGGVVYFALERSDLVVRRLWAHIEKLRASGELTPEMEAEAWQPIAVVPDLIDLTRPEGIKRVVETVKEAAKEVGQISLIIFDTFAKLIAAGGLDENSAQHQGMVFANIQAVHDQLNRYPHIALVGHTGKDVDRGARGSNALVGHVDMMVTISGNEIKTAEITKANDMPEGPLFSFKSEVHQFGTDEDGDPITVNVVSNETVSETVVKRRDKWPKGLKLVHEAITGALLDSGTDHRVAGDGPIVRAVNVAAARSIHAQRFVSAGEGDRDAAERQAWRRNFAKARQSDLIGAETANGQELVWLIAG